MTICVEYVTQLKIAKYPYINPRSFSAAPSHLRLSF
jgi:hypothetical protein